MIKYFFNEKFVELILPKGSVRKRYAISNYGRVVSFDEDVKEGRLLNCSYVQGYTTLKINLKNQPITNKSFFLSAGSF